MKLAGDADGITARLAYVHAGFRAVGRMEGKDWKLVMK